MKTWQVSFIVEGLHVPKEDTTYNEELLVRRHGEADNEAEVYMKIAEAETKSNGSLCRPFERKFDRILQLYGLETSMHAKRSSGWSATAVTEETPFGQPPAKRLILKLRGPSYPQDSVGNLYFALEFAIRKQKGIEQVFGDSRKAFVRHGLDYYHRALGENTSEKKAIDLFIALESLFSKDQELRFRISLRVSSLLGLIGKDRTNVFKTTYNLYNKRSRIVHGVAKVDLSWEQINKLEKYIRDCLKIFFHLEMSKDKIIDMLDASLYSDRAKSELQKLVTEAYEKWKE